MNLKRLPLARYLVVLGYVALTVGAPVALFGRAGVVVAIVGGMMWGLVVATDQPKKAFPAWLEWALPVKGKWGQYLLLYLIFVLVLTLPFWARWIAG